MTNLNYSNKARLAKSCLIFLLSVVFLCGCSDVRKLDGKLIIMDGKVYRLENRFGEGYWFIEVPSSDTIVLRVGEKHY